MDSPIKRVNGGELCAKNQTWLPAYMDKIENNNTSTDARDESTKNFAKDVKKINKEFRRQADEPRMATLVFGKVGC